MDNEQTNLNNFLPASARDTFTVTKAVGAKGGDEMRAAVARADVRPVTHDLISAAALRRLGHDVPDDLTFLTDATARDLLPAEFFGVEVAGVAYAAPRRLPRESVTYYTANDVEAIKAALSDLRAEAKAKAEADTAARAERWRRTIAGEVGVLLRSDLVSADDVREAERREARERGVGANVVGRQVPASPDAIRVEAETAVLTSDGFKTVGNDSGERVGADSPLLDSGL